MLGFDLQELLNGVAEASALQVQTRLGGRNQHSLKLVERGSVWDGPVPQLWRTMRTAASALTDDLSDAMRCEPATQVGLLARAGLSHIHQVEVRPYNT